MDSRARTPKAEATRARILDAALRLFNDRGTAEVSTNHVAAEAGLSPGNLYYHFQDKKEIVRALHNRYAAEFDNRWDLVADAAQNLRRLRQNITDGMRLAWEYRFLEREVLALLRADPVLRTDYRAVNGRRLDQWAAFAEHLIAQGLLRPPRPPLTMRDLTVAVWLIAQSWLSFLDATGDATDAKQAAKGADLVLIVLDPYLTAKGRRLI